jgi:hypothetical protein
MKEIQTKASISQLTTMIFRNGSPIRKKAELKGLG